MRILTLLLACLLLPSLAGATVFTPPPTDKSVELLGTIFGTNIGPVYLGGAPNPALIRMFELFNAVIITIGTVIVSYIGLVSTINTAQEGKTMGKKWSSIWIPLRATLGMVLIVPTPSSGYSVIQSSVMWFILQGVGAADHIWNGILGDLGSGLSVSTAVREHADADIRTDLKTQGDALTEQVLRAAVCTASLNAIGNGQAAMMNDFRAPRDSVAGRLGTSVKWYNLINPTPSVSDQQAKYTGTSYIGINGDEQYFDICGKFRIEATVNRDDWLEPEKSLIKPQDLEKKAYEIYMRKQKALESMFNNLMPLAIEIVAERVQPRNSQNRLFKPLDDQIIEPAGYNELSSNIYTLELRSLIVPHRIDALRNVVRAGTLDGWITAGSFYFALSHETTIRYFDSIKESPVAEAVPSCDKPEICNELLPLNSTVFNPKMRNFLAFNEEQTFLAKRLSDARIYLNYDETKISDRFVSKNDDDLGTKDIPLKNPDWIMTLFNEQHNDPILAQGKFGNSLMVYSEKLWEQKIRTSQALIHELPQDGENIPKEIRDLLSKLETESALALSVYGIVWVIGATLAIYIPLIPYMIFTIAVVGWFLLVIEAIVAAPMLALSFILPSGEELGKIMQGLMLLLNIMLRPTLMLFGFILAIRLYKAVVLLVNFSLMDNLNNLHVDSQYAWVATITIYGTFITTLANKCFALIYALPDKIMRWMGGGPEHTDVSQEVHGVKNAIGKGADVGRQVSTGYGERELVRIQNQMKQIGNTKNNLP